MINKLKNDFNLSSYKRTIGYKTNIHKVSYFFKPDMDILHNKRILFLDFEFSMNKIICELGGFVLNNNKIEDLIFKEYSLPQGEPYWSFEKSCFVNYPMNVGKPLFNDSDKEWLFNLVESVDYVIVHNYVAEAQCFLKLALPQEKYNIKNCSLFNNDKFICTSYSFKNKYFKSLGMEKFSNSEVSSFFGWEVKDKKGKLKIKNKDLNLKFYIDKPIGVNSELHNSFYDSVVTLTNFMSLKRIIG